MLSIITIKTNNACNHRPSGEVPLQRQMPCAKMLASNPMCDVLRVVKSKAQHIHIKAFVIKCEIV